MRAYEPNGSNEHDELCRCPGCGGDLSPEEQIEQAGVREMESFRRFYVIDHDLKGPYKLAGVVFPGGRVVVDQGVASFEGDTVFECYTLEEVAETWGDIEWVDQEGKHAND